MNDPLDPELLALPPPRRTGLWVTTAALAAAALSAAALGAALSAELRYSMVPGPPEDRGALGELLAGDVAAGAPNAGRWVRAQGLVASRGVVRFTRPLDPDSYRLYPTAEEPRLWVVVRVPSGAEAEFVPPTSFVGRLVPASAAGLRHGPIADAARSHGVNVPTDAWLLIDGESPGSLGWTWGVMALLVSFAGFAGLGAYRLLRPMRAAERRESDEPASAS